MSYRDTRDLQAELEDLEKLKELRDEADEALRNYDESIANNPGDKTDDAYVEPNEHTRACLAGEVDDAEINFDEERYDALIALKAEIGESDFEYGVTLIPVDDFEDYAKELVEDCGDLPRDLPSYIVIDWGATAENIKDDYASVSFDGDDYYYRT